VSIQEKMLRGFSKLIKRNIEEKSPIGPQPSGLFFCPIHRERRLQFRQITHHHLPNGGNTMKTFKTIHEVYDAELSPAVKDVVLRCRALRGSEGALRDVAH
jgi:hypothetical protein